MTVSSGMTLEWYGEAHTRTQQARGAVTWNGRGLLFSLHRFKKKYVYLFLFKSRLNFREIGKC